MSISFAGKVAVVTGAGRGLGRAYALDLARRGADVVVNDLGDANGGGPSRAERVAAEIIELGGRAVASHDDVATGSGGQAIVERALSAFGTIEAVVCNAGFMRSAPFGSLTSADIRDVIDVHLLAAFNVLQPAWQIMTKKDYGRIVMTSSSAILGSSGNSNYSAAKAGIIGLAKSLALEGRDKGIRVNVILPSAVSQITAAKPNPTEEARRYREKENMLKDRRVAEAVAPLVSYLASDACSVSGEVYSAMAGRFARVATVIATGWLNDDPAHTTAEQIAANLDAINDVGGGLIPTCITDELDAVIAAVRRAGG